MQNGWAKSDGLDYRLSENNGILRLHVMPNELGSLTLKLPLQTDKPAQNQNKKPQYNFPVIQKTFTVKVSCLTFINIDKKEITSDDAARTKGVEGMIENNWAINLQKTYRIEDQEQPGGVLLPFRCFTFWVWKNGYIFKNILYCMAEKSLSEFCKKFTR